MTMTPHAGGNVDAPRLLDLLLAALDDLQGAFVALARAVMRFEVDGDAGVVAATRRLQCLAEAARAAERAASHAVDETDGNESTRIALHPRRRAVVAAAQRLQKVQAETHRVVKNAHAFTAAYSRALTVQPSSSVGYTRRAVAATEANFTALHDARG